MHKAIFVLVPSFSNSAWLNDKMMQITKSFISITNNDGYPIEVVDSYYDIEKYLDEGSNIIRKISDNITIRKGAKGEYIFYKTK